MMHKSFVFLSSLNFLFCALHQYNNRVLYPQNQHVWYTFVRYDDDDDDDEWNLYRMVWELVAWSYVHVAQTLTKSVHEGMLWIYIQEIMKCMECILSKRQFGYNMCIHIST